MPCLRLISFLLFFMLCFSCKNEPKSKEKPLVQASQHFSEGKNGMVVSAHPLASQIGLAVLKSGGNAIDAAIAIQFALAVVYPRAGNLGGGGFAVVHTADGKNDALDFREKAPIKASKNMYLDADGDVIARLSVDGHLAVAVPGTVHGLFTLKSKYGSDITMDSLIQPAIELAKFGFNISKSEAERLNKYQQDFASYNDTTCAFIREKWNENDKLVQTDLAQSLSRIQQDGVDGFYKGKTAELLLKEINTNQGILSQEDLDKYTSVWRTPININYKDYQINAMSLPSSGGIVLGQILSMYETLEKEKLDYHSEEYLHLLAEIEKRAYADRADFLGDEDFVEVPIDKLLSKAYLEEKIADFHPDSIKPIDKVFENVNFQDLESYETTHISVVDKTGNAVAMTITLNGNYGSKVVVDGAGFFLNNEMDDFSAKPGTPNIYGLIGSEANAIQAEKRMLSSMTPTIVTDKMGKVRLVLGTPGGSTIITSVLQVILNVLDEGMDIQKAVNMPRFHHQGIPNQILIEKGKFDERIINGLKTKGHAMKTSDRIGIVKAIEYKDGSYYGSGDYRNPDDCSLGY